MSEINYTKLTKRFKKELKGVVPDQWVWPITKSLLDAVKDAIKQAEDEFHT